jgi:uncharacterized protein (UPF0335 family)
MAGIGDNSIAADQLRLYLERVENISRDIDDLKSDVKDVYTEAKAMGYDTKIMRKLVALRKMDQAARIEAQMLLETYAAAIGLDLI